MAAISPLHKNMIVIGKNKNLKSLIYNSQGLRWQEPKTVWLFRLVLQRTAGQNIGSGWMGTYGSEVSAVIDQHLDRNEPGVIRSADGDTVGNIYLVRYREPVGRLLHPFYQLIKGVW